MGRLSCVNSSPARPRRPPTICWAARRLVAAKLRETFSQLNPGVRFVGASFHGKCLLDGRLEGAAEHEVIAEINRLSPDFIWVGFGTPKQQAWIKRNKSLIRRGVVLTVGFAFDVNAGMKPDAPAWMQRLGLTWVFRLWSEPRRLGPRYPQIQFPSFSGICFATASEVEHGDL